MASIFSQFTWIFKWLEQFNVCEQTGSAPEQAFEYIRAEVN